jgi:hypothetical protein
VLLFLLNLIKGALQRELDQFFQVLSAGDVAERVVTKSAFCAARQKLNPSAFIELNRHLVRRWYHDAPVQRWLDLRAIDGSTLRLPDTPGAIAHFGQMFPAHSNSATLARISQDPLNGLILDALIAPYQRDERDLLVEHLAALEAGSLLLLDMGYPAFWAPFRRASSAGVPASRSTPGRWSATSWRPGATTRRSTLTPKLRRPAGLPTTAIPVRLIRVLLPTGTVEILMTSLLDRDDHPAEEFATLYHLRWAQEENYKCFKCRVEVENWSGKSSLAIRQDFHAFTLNLTAVLTRTAQQQEQHCGDSHPKQVNLTHALCAMKGTLVRLLTQSDPLELLRALINVFARTIEPVRPRRLYPRRKGLHGYHMTYKPCS